MVKGDARVVERACYSFLLLGLEMTWGREAVLSSNCKKKASVEEWNEASMLNAPAVVWPSPMGQAQEKGFLCLSGKDAGPPASDAVDVSKFGSPEVPKPLDATFRF